jgi:undecaprenyl phosphate N,N'-diacetylbacillosamine 1-phosphate transferase
MYKRISKRFLDIVVALIAFVIFTPIFLIVVIVLAWLNKGKIFFIQSRPGFLEKPFNVIKFKTMNDAKDEFGNLLPDKMRITSVGRFVRKTSLDEIPQLLNVLKGDMSLVGPRPLLFKYLPLYNETQRRRHHVRPGITGWAQVNGRNSISWSEKFKYDVEYVDNLTFALDVKIMWLTISKVLKREGINQREDMPMQPFSGNN